MNKAMAFAILISLAMVGGSFLVVGESHALTPQTGKVSVQLTYGSNLGGIPVSSKTTFTIKTLSGTTVASGSGALQSFTLPYGTYYIDVNPLYTGTSTHGQIIANKTVQKFTLQQANMPLSVSQSAAKAQKNYIDVQGITTGTANVSLETTSGFTYKTVEMNDTTNNQSLYVPEYGTYYLNVNYSGTDYSSIHTFSTTGTQKVSLPSSDYISGFVSTKSGAALSHIEVILYNDTSTPSYSVSNFSSAAFTLQSHDFTNKKVFVTAPGYNTSQITPPATGGKSYPITLEKANSSVYTNYSLSGNMQNLYANTTLDLGNYTTLPSYFGNSTVGSLYWQLKLDGITSATPAIQDYMTGLVQNYTNNTIMVQGYNYNLTTAPSFTSVTFHNTGSTVQVVAKVSAEYKNVNVPADLGTKGYSVKVYELGTKMLPGSLYYKDSFKYDNPTLSLSSSSSPTYTAVKQINITPVSSSQWITLSLTPTKNPAVVDSNIMLYWTGMTSKNYLLNSTASNTVFIGPVNKNIYLDASNAYNNRATGSTDTSKATFVWNVGGTVVSGVNVSAPASAFSANTTVTLTATSEQGGVNTTTFHILTSNAAPNVNYTVSLNGKTLGKNANTISVPQSAVSTYSAFGSSLNLSGYSIPLTYNWKMENYSAQAQNATYAFDKPSYPNGVGLQYANITVTTVYGQIAYKNITVNVTDTTPPVAKMALTNSTGASVSQPTAGQVTTFSANKSYDPYYKDSSTLTYNWTFEYANGTAIKNGSGVIDVVGGGMNMKYVQLKVNTLSTVVVSLKVSNPSNASAYKNKTVNVIVNTPRLVVNNIYFKGNMTQGSQTTFYVNVSNNGTIAVSDFTISILINGNQVSSHTFQKTLAPGHSANVSYNYTPAVSGKQTLHFQANNNTEPAFMASVGSHPLAVTIGQPAYKIPLIVGSIIGVIVVIGVVYYRLSSSRSRKPRQPKPKTELKKSTSQKPAEKKQSQDKKSQEKKK